MKLSKAYSDVIYNLWDEKNRKGVFAPTYFKEIISKENKKFEGNEANDSKDLILFLYQRLHNELNANNKKKIIIENIDSFQTDPEIEYFKCVNEFESKNKSIISDLFYYNQASITKCLNCGKSKYKFLMFNILIFALENTRLFKSKKEIIFHLLIYMIVLNIIFLYKSKRMKKKYIVQNAKTNVM